MKKYLRSFFSIHFSHRLCVSIEFLWRKKIGQQSKKQPTRRDTQSCVTKNYGTYVANNSTKQKHF